MNISSYRFVDFASNPDTEIRETVEEGHQQVFITEKSSRGEKSFHQAFTLYMVTRHQNESYALEVVSTFEVEGENSQNIPADENTNWALADMLQTSFAHARVLWRQFQDLSGLPIRNLQFETIAEIYLRLVGKNMETWN